MRLFNPYRVLLILGNGFDLSLGLKTSYNDFIESDLFKKNVNIIRYPNSRVDLHDRNLFNYLIQQKRLKKWIDVEEELMRYASVQRVEYYNQAGGLHNMPNASDDQIRFYFEVLCYALQTYMASLDYTDLYDDALSLGLFREVVKYKHNDIVSFNYTDLNRLTNNSKCNIDYIHGNIKDGIILGFQRFKSMAPGYEYMIKSEHELFKSRRLPCKMSEADEIIVFGHSLGVTDHVYFKSFFDTQTSIAALSKKLTIITKDRESRKSIVKQMVALSNGQYTQFQDNTDVVFIETSNENEFKQYIKELSKRLSRWF